MRKLSLLFILLVVFNSFSCTHFKTKNDFDIKFGLMRKDNTGTYYVYQETQEIPKLLEQTGFRYGYTVEKTDNSTFTSFMILYPPTPLKIYKYRDSSKKESRIEAGVVPVIRTKPVEATGKISTSISFDTSDPIGDWKLEIYINHKLVRTIKYSVVNSKKDTSDFIQTSNEAQRGCPV